MSKIPVGISACLLGKKVRYDGGHKLQRVLIDALSDHVRWIPVCPETECGLGVPREPMQLTDKMGSPRLITLESGRDHTDRVIAWANKRLLELEQESLCGFILKSRSPSCAISDAPVVDPKSGLSANGSGIFARALMNRLPLLRLSSEETLANPNHREAFLADLNIRKNH